MRSAADLAVNRRITEAIIADNPTVIPIQRTVRVRTASGGFTEVRSDLPRMTVRLIDQSGASTPAIAADRVTDGNNKRIQFVLLASWNTQLVQGDFWEDGLWDWNVEQVFPDNGYEVRAMVTREPGIRNA